MQYIYIFGIIVGAYCFLGILGEIRNRYGYEMELGQAEDWIDRHLRGGWDKSRMFIRHRPTGHCIEFYKWAPPLRSFCEYEPSKYYLILREGEHCDLSEFQYALEITEEKVEGHRIDLSETDERVIKAEIGPNAELGGDLIKSIYREAFEVPNNNLRACFTGRVNIRIRGPLAGWNDRTTLTAQKNAEQKKYEGKSKLHQWAPVKKVSWKSPLKDRINKNRKDIDIQNEYGVTPLVASSYFGSFDVAEVLLEEGADIRARDNSGRTALHCAAWKGREGVAQLLLDHGAPTDITDSEGKTPLDLAKEYDYPEIVRLLSETGEKAGEDQTDEERVKDSDVNQTSNSGIPEKEEFNEQFSGGDA